MRKTKQLRSFSKIIRNIIPDNLNLEWDECILKEHQANEEAIILHHYDQAITLYESVIETKKYIIECLKEKNIVKCKYIFSLVKSQYCISKLYTMQNQGEQAKKMLRDILGTPSVITGESCYYEDYRIIIRQSLLLYTEIK